MRAPLVALAVLCVLTGACGQSGEHLIGPPSGGAPTTGPGGPGYMVQSGKVKGLRFSTLEAICRELACQPGDILEYAPDEGAETIKQAG